MGDGISCHPIDIAISGLRCENTRMKVIADNIAHANTFDSELTRAYRRRDVMVSSAGEGISGVSVEGVWTDPSLPLRRVHMPNHPAADADGWVTMSNVDIPTEMMQMIVASRAYQANVSVMQRYQDMMETTLQLLR